MVPQRTLPNRDRRFPSLLGALGLAALLAVAACTRDGAHELRSGPEPTPAPSAAPSAKPLSSRLSRPGVAHVVAIGDLHGDLDAARRALRLAGATDGHDAWIGGALVVVQTGDEIDRADGDRGVLDLFERLKGEAAKAGGAVIALDGNHELMNASLDFRYVTPAGFASFGDLASPARSFDTLPQSERGRAAAFAPGGTYAAELADRPLFVEVGDTVFVHGGVLPKHVHYGLDRMNDEVDDWLRGRRPSCPAVVAADDGPLWTRDYSAHTTQAGCEELGDVLGELGKKRMVVGHTVQSQGINAACDGRVWRIDTGMSRAFGGPIEVLDIQNDVVTVRRETARPPG